MGKLVYELGKTSELLGERYQHRLILQLLRKPELADAKIKSQLDKSGRNGFTDAENHLNAIMAPLDQAHMARSDAEQIHRQCQMTASLVRLACHLGTARINANGSATPELPAATRHALAAELEPLIPEFKKLWLQANREGGLQESAEPLDVLLSILKE